VTIRAKVIGANAAAGKVKVQLTGYESGGTTPSEVYIWIDEKDIVKNGRTKQVTKPHTGSKSSLTPDQVAYDIYRELTSGLAETVTEMVALQRKTRESGTFDLIPDDAKFSVGISYETGASSIKLPNTPGILYEDGNLGISLGTRFFCLPGNCSDIQKFRDACKKNHITQPDQFQSLYTMLYKMQSEWRKTVVSFQNALDALEPDSYTME
jgi:hypothetical protein